MTVTTRSSKKPSTCSCSKRSIPITRSSKKPGSRSSSKRKAPVTKKKSQNNEQKLNNTPIKKSRSSQDFQDAVKNLNDNPLKTSRLYHGFQSFDDLKKAVKKSFRTWEERERYLNKLDDQMKVKQGEIAQKEEELNFLHKSYLLNLF